MRVEPAAPLPGGRTPLGQLASLALVALAAGGCAAVLYLGHAVFVPIAFAILFALVLSSPVEALHRRGIPRALGAVTMLLLILGVAGLTLRVIWDPARAWIAGIPRTTQIIERRLGPVARALEHRFASPARGTQAPADEAASSLAEDFEMSASGSLLVATPAAAADAVTIVILTLFLVTGGAPMTARLASTLISHGKSAKALHIVEAVRSEVARYYVTIALINLGLGAATALVTLLLGLPNPLLWGTMAALLNFLPYIGSTITLLVLTTVSIATFERLGHAIAVVASFLVLVTIEGQVIEPLFVGRRLKLSPTVVLLAFWFGGWFWGISGIVLVMPLLVAIKVVAEHLPNGRIVAELLSPAPSRRLRLMSGTPHAAGVSAAPEQAEAVGPDPVVSVGGGPGVG